MAFDVAGFLSARFPGTEFFNLDSHQIALSLTPLKKLNTALAMAFFYPKGVVQVSGREAATFLQGIITNDINLLSEKKAIQSLITRANGKILFDCLIEKKTSVTYLIYTEPGDENKLIEFLNYYHIAEELTIKPAANDYLLFVFDKSKSLKKQITPIFERHASCLNIIKTNELTAQILDGLALQFIGIQEFDELRPIFSWPRSGIDFDGNNFPQEAGLTHFVSYTKGCFIGQEPIARMYHKARPTKVMCLISSSVPLKPGANIEFADKKAGIITSASQIISVGNYHSLGFVKTMIINDSASDSQKAGKLTCLGNNILVTPLA